MRCPAEQQEAGPTYIRRLRCIISISREMGFENDDLYDEPENVTTQTAIQNRYCFWYHKRGKTLSNTGGYEDNILKVASFQTVEHFWRIYDHLVRPNEFKTPTDYHLFKHGIKPTWEDPQNEKGGKWMVRLKKGLSSLYWEEIVLAIIGEQFDVGHEICGAVVSVRSNEDIISVWNKNADNTEAKNKIRDQIRRILKLPTFVAVEYKKHQDSMTDRSSFRNTDVWRAPAPVKTAQWGDRGHDRTTPHGDRPKPAWKASRFGDGAEPSPKEGRKFDLPTPQNSRAWGKSDGESTPKDRNTRSWHRQGDNAATDKSDRAWNNRPVREGWVHAGTTDDKRSGPRRDPKSRFDDAADETPKARDEGAWRRVKEDTTEGK